MRQLVAAIESGLLVGLAIITLAVLAVLVPPVLRRIRRTSSPLTPPGSMSPMAEQAAAEVRTQQQHGGGV